MPITEHQRHQIFQWYEEAMGPDRAPIMMELLPPVGWGEVATKTDLMVLEGRLRGEMAELRGELRGELALLRGEMVALAGELRGEMAELRGEMAELRGEMHQLAGGLRMEMAHNLRTMVATTVASNVALVAAVFGIVRVFGV